MKFYNPFKPHIVKFRNGDHEVRKLFFYYRVPTADVAAKLLLTVTPDKGVKL